MRWALLGLLVLILITYSFSTTTLHIVGVSQENGHYVGVVANLTVIKKPGTGRVFISTDPLAKVDTQASARLAHDVACQVLNANCSKYDFYYIITSSAPLIGGPSAGAAMTVATMAELTNKTVYSNVAITGTITPYGDIGPVGGVYEKMQAASSFADVFLVPVGETKVEVTQDNVTKTVDLTKYAAEHNMKVIPVEDIYQAFKYMTGYQIKLPQTKVIKYNQAGMKNIANGLISYANTKKNNANFNYKLLTNNQSTKLKGILNVADKNLENANTQIKLGNYYSAASFAVGAITNYDYAINLYNLYTNNTNFFDEQVKKIKSNIKLVNLTITNTKIDSIEDIEAISIAYDRMMDASTSLNQAIKDYNSGNKELAMYELAYSDMRSVSSYDWLFLLNYFHGNLSMKFDNAKLKPLAIKKIDLANTYVTYADILIGTQADMQAHEHLNAAVNAYEEGNYLYAIFEATKAYATASIEIEAPYILSGSNTSLNEFMIGTERTINRAESSGVVPIMAVNYLEYANTLKDKDPLSAFIYYAYARNFAYLPMEIAKYENIKVHTNHKVILENYFTIYKHELENTLITQAMLVISGFLAGLAIAYWRFDLRKR